MLRVPIILFLSLSAAAYNGYVKHRPLTEVADSVNFMLEVEIVDVSHDVQRHVLYDGSLGPVIFEHTDYVAVVRSVLYGDWTGKTPKFRFRHSFRMPFHYDRRGNNIGRFTPVVPGSGLEDKLRIGVRYVVMFNRMQPTASRENRLVRAEFAGNKARVHQIVLAAKQRLRNSIRRPE